jgi:protein TonB
MRVTTYTASALIVARVRRACAASAMTGIALALAGCVAAPPAPQFSYTGNVYEPPYVPPPPPPPPPPRPPQPTPVPEPPPPTVNGGGGIHIISPVIAGPVKPEPPPPPLPPVDMRDCTGWWRPCHAYQ